MMNQKYLIFGNEYTEVQLLNEGYTDNEGTTYSFRKKDDGLYAVSPATTVFEVSTVTLRDTNFGVNTVIGGEHAQKWQGTDNMFEIEYAVLGELKLLMMVIFGEAFRLLIMMMLILY